MFIDKHIENCLFLLIFLILDKQICLSKHSIKYLFLNISLAKYGNSAKMRQIYVF